MQYYQTQKHKKTDLSGLVITICIVASFTALAFVYGQYHEANMQDYATANHCTWHNNGTFYGDSRDNTCQ